MRAEIKVMARARKATVNHFFVSLCDDWPLQGNQNREVLLQLDLI